ncbi:MAG: prepilin-type N-terminal cleavage/methylation domain-containing protein [Erysipelotrichia bacterium]|nr:prepilin-type N-terminal cleavage/methylation domain-containing protein [Erysipelotrichia bacterium]
MLRKGFTLIELLIVITIIAILAGAAVPFVQDYVEDARMAKVRADLDEIRNALIRYELDTGKVFVATVTADLVGPYLAKSMMDPWGSSYCVGTGTSEVFSLGPDRATQRPSYGITGAAGTSIDDIAVDFRPPLAPTKAFYMDADNDGFVNSGDQVKVRFTREIATSTVTDYGFWIGTAGASNSAVVSAIAEGSDGRDVILTIDGDPVFVPGRDELSVGPEVKDLGENGGNACRSNKVIIKGL